MGNNSSASIDEFPCSSLKDFQEKETPRKMTMHILSDNREDCISFVELNIAWSIVFVKHFSQHFIFIL